MVIVVGIVVVQVDVEQVELVFDVDVLVGVVFGDVVFEGVVVDVGIQGEVFWQVLVVVQVEVLVIGVVVLDIVGVGYCQFVGFIQCSGGDQFVVVQFVGIEVGVVVQQCVEIDVGCDVDVVVDLVVDFGVWVVWIEVDV